METKIQGVDYTKFYKTIGKKISKIIRKYNEKLVESVIGIRKSFRVVKRTFIIDKRQRMVSQ